MTFLREQIMVKSSDEFKWLHSDALEDPAAAA